jgi:NADPH:quinone reductase-like Zn-dependent oxidoreductase
MTTLRCELVHTSVLPRVCLTSRATQPDMRGPLGSEGFVGELIVAGEQTLARKPDGVGTATAGVAPVAAVTAAIATDPLESRRGRSC